MWHWNEQIESLIFPKHMTKLPDCFSFHSRRDCCSLGLLIWRSASAIASKVCKLSFFADCIAISLGGGEYKVGSRSEMQGQSPSVGFARLCSQYCVIAMSNPTGSNHASSAFVHRTCCKKWEDILKLSRDNKALRAIREHQGFPATYVHCRKTRCAFWF